MGAIAMTAFFMLSGYSLHLSTRNRPLNNVTDVKRFFIKRFISIAPLYYFVSLIYVFVLSEETFLQNVLLFPIETLGLQSEMSLFNVSHNGGTWFISVLFLCYFLFPYLKKLLSSISVRNKVFLFFSGFFIIVLSAFVGKVFDVHIYSNPLIRTIEFSMGIILAEINETPYGEKKILDLLRNKHIGYLSLIALFLAVTFVIKLGLPKDYIAYNIIAIPCFASMMLSWGFQKIKLSHRIEKIILYISKVTYPFFLVQIILWPLCNYLLSIIGYDSNLFRIVLAFITCTILAIVLHECIDKPIGVFLKKRLL